MSPLAFDKQGKPFAWNPRTRRLKVRLFRTPAARGTCCQVLDAAGAPLYVDAETDYAEFRRAIGNVPGFYRLDQCDDDCVEIEGAAPAYVSVEHLRNAQAVDSSASSAEVNPLVIIQSMAAIQADVMKTMAAQQAALMAATAEIMRAPYRPAPPAPAPEHRNASDEDDDDDELEDEEEEVPPSNEILGMLGPILPKMAERFGAEFGQRVVNLILGLGRTPDPQATAPAATPAPTPVSQPAPAPTAPHAHGPQAGVAAGQGSMPVPQHAEFAADDDLASEVTDEGSVTFNAAASAPMAPASVVSSGSTSDAPLAVPAPTTPVPQAASAEPMIPTPEQMAHLFAIRESLTPTERTLAERVIARMAPDAQMQWIAALATKSIEDAVSEIRAVLVQLQRNKSR